MEIIIIFIIWILVMYFIKSKTTKDKIKVMSPTKLIQMSASFTTKENKSKIENLFRYHSGRVNAGAVFNESYNRLIKELNEIKNDER